MERKARSIVKRRPRVKGQGKFNTPFWKKKYSVEDIARTAYQGVQQIRRMINTEFKALDIYVSNSPNNSTFTDTFVTHLSAIDQGDTQSERSGLSVRPQHLRIRGHVVMNVAATNTCVRIIVFKDKQQVADTKPPTSSVLETATGFVVNNNYNYISNQENSTRFKILADIRVVVSTQNPLALFDLDIPLRGHITFNAPVNSDIQKDGHFLLACSDQSTNTPTVTWSSRLVFTDD